MELLVERLRKLDPPMAADARERLHAALARSAEEVLRRPVLEAEDLATFERRLDLLASRRAELVPPLRAALIQLQAQPWFAALSQDRPLAAVPR